MPIALVKTLPGRSLQGHVWSHCWLALGTLRDTWQHKGRDPEILWSPDIDLHCKCLKQLMDKHVATNEILMRCTKIWGPFKCCVYVSSLWDVRFHQMVQNEKGLTQKNDTENHAIYIYTWLQNHAEQYIGDSLVLVLISPWTTNCERTSYTITNFLWTAAGCCWRNMRRKKDLALCDADILLAVLTIIFLKNPAQLMNISGAAWKGLNIGSLTIF